MPEKLHLTGEDIQALNLSKNRVRKIPPNRKAIYYQGDLSLPMVVLRGTVSLTSIDPNGNEHLVEILSSPSVIGVEGFLSEEERNHHTARPFNQEPIVLYELPRDNDQLREELKNNPNLDNLINTLLAQQILDAYANNAMLRLPMVERTLIALEKIQDAFGNEKVKVTQDMLAGFVNGTRETVSTIMNGLREQGFVDYTRGQFNSHIDPSKLERAKKYIPGMLKRSQKPRKRRS